MTSNHDYLGDLPSQLLAAITLVGVIAAIYAGKYAKRDVGIEQDRDDLRDDLAYRSQADAVSAWVELSMTPGRFGEQLGLVICANNESGLVISDVVCTLYVKVKNENSYTYVDSQELGIVPPRNSFRTKIDSQILREIVGSELPQSPTVEQLLEVKKKTSVEISFIDADKVPWLRNYHGRLFQEPLVERRTSRRTGAKSKKPRRLRILFWKN